MAVGVDEGEMNPALLEEDAPGLIAEMGIAEVVDAVDSSAMVGPVLPDSERCTFTWRVDSFNRIRQLKQYSPVFYSGPHAWRLLMFPAGNNCLFLSVYLDVADGPQLQQHWARQAHFTLSVHNTIESSRSVHKESDHIFHARANDWGFREFIPLADVRDPSTGFLNEDGSLEIVCTVDVAWQPSQHMDSKKETGFVGLKNQGATCYMNSLLQTLVHIPYFRKAVYHMPTREDEDAESSIPLALQRIFYKLQHSDTSVSTKQLTKSFGWDTADTFMQHDVQELLRVLVDKLEEKMKGTSVEGTMSHLFEGKLTNYVKCVHVDDISRRDEPFYDLQVPVKGHRTIMEAFDEYVKEETLDGENQYASDKYGKQDAKRGVQFKALPPVLHLHLLRFEFDYATEQMAKINSRFEFPEMLDLDVDGRKYLTADSDPSVRNLYKLHSVLVHSGGLNGGHYYVYVQPFGAEHNERWYKFDDERVTCVQGSEAIEGSWGDDSAAEPRPQGIGGYYRAGGGPKVSSAYMLVYIRESAIRELNCAVTDADIVQHLRAQLEREQLDKLRKRKERNEAHLYTVMKVATAADVAKQIGDTQLFDLVDHERVAQLRVKKEETLWHFKQMLAAEFGVPVHRQRLWTWVSRQNKTYRPDKPLQLEYADETPVMDVKDEPAPGAHYQRVQAEIRLYLEVVDETLAAPPPLHAEYVLGEPMDEGGAQYPLLRADDVFLFVKYFDAEAQAVSFVGTHLARSTDRLSDLVPVLRALKGLDASQELVVYEEVEFESTVLFNAIREDRTLRDAEVQNGDILVFQLLSDLPATDDDAAAMLVDGQPPSPASAAASGAPALTVPAFFEAFKNRVTVNLFKLPQTSEAANIREREPPIKLPMDKRMTYLDVTAAVAAAVGCESSHVRLTMHNVYTEQPKPQPIAYQGANVLLELLMATGQRVSDTLYYEVLDIPLREFESKKSLKVSWHNLQAEETKVLNLLLAKETTVGHALEMIMKQVPLELPTTDASGAPLPVERCVRLLETYHSRIYKVLGQAEQIHSINDNYWTIRAEELPLDERDLAAEGEDKVVPVRHIYQEPKASVITNFGDPFLLVLAPAETVVSVSARIRERLKMTDDEFAKLKVGIVTQGRVEALDEVESVRARVRKDEHVANWEDYICIEHPALPAGPGARRRNTSRYHDKPIKIYG